MQREKAALIHCTARRIYSTNNPNSPLGTDIPQSNHLSQLSEGEKGPEPGISQISSHKPDHHHHKNRRY
jgi:hypothetical protein